LKSTDRGVRETVKSRTKGRAPEATIRLAAGVRLDGAEATDGAAVLVCPDGRVQLNRIAASILRLCDGSRNREDVVAEVVRRSNQQARAVEIVEFLEVARARGWIDEA
jgi:pyrroloquinoline quinone biosynthesis protein D